MDCNKDEAVRAKEIAKRKFLANDVAGAKKFALKAQSLYPELEEISQMIATCDVHLSVANKINGEVDWYGVLGLSPDVNDDTVRRQYRKLAIMLHPDKNKSVGAEGAFKYISQAWSLLSDKSRRAEYDRKLYQNVSNLGGSSSVNPGKNGFYNFTRTGSSNNVKGSKSGKPRAGHSTPQASTNKAKHDGTFWTVCHRCMTQYEYLRVYLNHNLLCPNCHEAFLAVETAPPGAGSIRRSFSQEHWNTSQQAVAKNKTGSGRDNGVYGNYDSYSQTNFQWGVFSGTENAAHAGPRRDEGVRRKYSKRMSVASSANTAAKRRRAAENTGMTSHGGNISNGVAAKSSDREEISQLHIENMLKKKAKCEIRKPRESDNVTAAEPAVKRMRYDDEKGNLEGENSSKNKEACNQIKANELADGKNELRRLNSSCNNSASNRDFKIFEAPVVDVPEPDFCNFDKDRTERSFGDSQVWAVYDDFDGMPRCYAMIHSVMSLNPFKMRISWLTSDISSELRSLNWLGSGFAKTCGDFTEGRFEICRSLDYFSHKVRWTRGTQGEIRIYPRKGDVWALYRNWSPNWNYLGEVEANHKYDIVEVLEGYSEDCSVLVIPLLKVAGFKSVFHHHLDHKEARRIPREELSRFSHLIPSYLLTGQEALKAPKGCRELDPAATPLELLRVIHHFKEEALLEEETVKKENLANGVDVEVATDVIIVDGTEEATEEKEGKLKDSKVRKILMDISEAVKDDRCVIMVDETEKATEGKEGKLKDCKVTKILKDTRNKEKDGNGLIMVDETEIPAEEEGELKDCKVIEILMDT